MAQSHQELHLIDQTYPWEHWLERQSLCRVLRDLQDVLRKAYWRSGWRWRPINQLVLNEYGQITCNCRLKLSARDSCHPTVCQVFQSGYRRWKFLRKYDWTPLWPGNCSVICRQWFAVRRAPQRTQSEWLLHRLRADWQRAQLRHVCSDDDTDPWAPADHSDHWAWARPLQGCQWLGWDPYRRVNPNGILGPTVCPIHLWAYTYRVDTQPQLQKRRP